MTTARLFKLGNSQAVRLPKAFRFDVAEVEILKRGDEVVLRKPRRSALSAFAPLLDLRDLDISRPDQGKAENTPEF